MLEIIGRRVQVVKYSDNVGIAFTWFEKGREELSNMQSKHFHFYAKETYSKVEDIVNRLVSRWESVFISDASMATISECLDSNPKRFDWVVQNENEGEGIFFQAIEKL